MISGTIAMSDADDTDEPDRQCDDLDCWRGLRGFAQVYIAVAP